MGGGNLMFASEILECVCVSLLVHHLTYTNHSFYVLLTVLLGITSVNDKLEAQLFYFIIRLLQSSTCFEQRRAHHHEVKLY